MALAEAHRHGVIHRDIKPHNIFLTRDPFDSVGAVKVGDFGIARALKATTVTDTTFILGSVRYLSPEQAMGEPVGPRSDLYSLGVVLYEMLTGRVPFNGEGPIAIAMKHISELPPSPKQANPDVPESLEAVTQRLLSKDPAFRYPDALALAEDLRGLPEDFGLERSHCRRRAAEHSQAALLAQIERTTVTLWTRRRGGDDEILEGDFRPPWLGLQP